MMYVACFIFIGKTEQVDFFVMMNELYEYMVFIGDVKAFLKPGFCRIIIAVVVYVIVGPIVPDTGVMYNTSF